MYIHSVRLQNFSPFFSVIPHCIDANLQRDFECFFFTLIAFIVFRLFSSLQYRYLQLEFKADCHKRVIPSAAM